MLGARASRDVSGGGASLDVEVTITTKAIPIISELFNYGNIDVCNFVINS